MEKGLETNSRKTCFFFKTTVYKSRIRDSEGEKRRTLGTAQCFCGETVRGDRRATRRKIPRESWFVRVKNIEMCFQEVFVENCLAMTPIWPK